MNLITLSTRCFDDIWIAVASNSNDEIVRIGLSPNKAALLRRIMKRIPTNSEIKHSAHADALEVLGRIVRGEETNLIPRMDLSSVTEFQKATYTMLMRIPRGKVSTYSMIADAVGCRGGSRAVGNSMATNPLPLVVPCHRVVLSSRKLGGFSIPGTGKREALQLKRRILENEGVEFEGERVAARCLSKPKT